MKISHRGVAIFLCPVPNISSVIIMGKKATKEEETTIECLINLYAWLDFLPWRTMKESVAAEIVAVETMMNRK